MFEIGDKFRVVTPVDICKDVHWPIGTVVTVDHIWDASDMPEGTSGYDLIDSQGFGGSFAPSDLEGEHRWFEHIEEETHAKELGQAIATIWPSEACVVCRPGTNEEFRQHINGSEDFVLAQLIRTCIEHECHNLSFRIENHED